ncbi:MAG: hypothetical protein QNJ12_11505 [Ilumatobacter sp.]|uniref:hypothetical protein n=1 Tax=Ilumatobacter sp. TaxID=1967498 RepID=UPI002612C6F8|nr:hypothetical protein [Ilumatobacter sp.]MDJ0769416.1 hypothetical protein [Ilumatobacter sp.]
MCQITEKPEVVRAREQLGRFLIARARDRAHAVGFGFVASDDAPDTYEALQEAYVRSLVTKQPLPLTRAASSGPSRRMERVCERYDRASEIGYHYVDREVLGPDIGLSALFWHDTNHARLGLSFDLDQEASLSRWQLQQLRAAGFSSGSLEYQLMDAETRGQIECTRQIGRAPRDLRTFSMRAIAGGLDHALELEATNGAVSR